MADSNPASVTLESNPQQSQNPPVHTNPHPSSSSTSLPPPPPPQQQLSQPSQSIPAQPAPNPVAIPGAPVPVLPPLSYAPPPMVVVPPSAPSFRPVPQFTPVPQNVLFQPPGASTVPAAVPQTLMAYQAPPGGQPPNAALRPPFTPMPNGFTVVPGGVPPGTVQIPGLPRYPSPYPVMVRPGFPQRPIGPIGVLPRPPIPGVPGVPGIRPILPLIVRPVIPSIATEKPQTTVYVGKISPTVENNFILALLQLCGPVKSWKRAQDPSNGAPRGFGFCEFESAEGVLRALRLLSKFSIDGQELVLNVNQATRDYLERYVEKKTEISKKVKETEAPPVNKENGEGMANDGKNDQRKATASDEQKESNNSDNKENNNENFGIVTDEDKEADRGVLEKLLSMVEERLKAKPLPPPPALTPADNPENSNSEIPVKSRDGDSDPDTKNDVAEMKNDDDLTAGDNKQASENNDRAEASSPDRSRRPDRWSRERDRDRDRDLKREKDREIERYERETERERVRKERDQRRKIEDADRQYDEFVKEWEYREREKEKQRHYEKDREKEKERKRKKEIAYEEDENEDDEDSRKRWRRSTLEEKRKKRMREKEDDLLDKQREEEELIAAAAEAKRREEEEKLKQQEEEKEKQEALKSLSDRVANETEKDLLNVEESGAEVKDTAMGEGSEDDADHENHPSGSVAQNGCISDEPTAQLGPTKKLGFGLVGSGKRTAVASVFKYEDEDEEARKENKMRPLVPIDYSTEEIQAVHTPGSGPGPGTGQPNLAAAAEFAKWIVNERPDPEKDRSTKRSRHESTSNNNKKTHEADHGHEKGKASAENKKLVDVKQLIDMIPKTKDELFSYKINWAIYDEHALHERMRPWISKKITEFLGEEEATLVDYIVSSTQEHVEADHMLQLLQSILDEEAEMFVLKMWRMLIFEIKKVESGLASRTRT